MTTANEVLAAMKDHGADVRTYQGWDRPGAPYKARGVLVHHTASPARLFEKDPAPSLGWCVSAYDKPVANMLVGKVPGSTWLLAANNGAAYHCGNGGPWDWAGIPEGNRPDLLWGIEIDDPGTSTSGLSDYQVENTAKVLAALTEVYGWTDERAIGTHKCWTDLCHTGASKPGVHLGRKNDTIDGAWREFPGSDKPQPYNAPFWRELAKDEAGLAATWDGTIPRRYAAKRAFDEKKNNKATWRMACRLWDLGYRDNKPKPLGEQQYPTGAVKRFREAQGWNPGAGAPSKALWRRLFGTDKP